MSRPTSTWVITVSASAADTNDRPAGNRRSSEVCDRNTRRGTTRSCVPAS
jgi:hypothetical protein